MSFFHDTPHELPPSSPPPPPPSSPPPPPPSQTSSSTPASPGRLSLFKLFGLPYLGAGSGMQALQTCVAPPRPAGARTGMRSVYLRFIRSTRRIPRRRSERRSELRGRDRRRA